MKTKRGAVCAFIEEHPPHSKHNIKSLVESLKNISDLHVVVIANGCEVSESLKNFFYEQPRLIFLELSMNVGLPIAWNLGIDLLDFLRCDQVFFLNDDLWVDKYCIEELAKIFELKSDSAVVGVEGVVCKEVDERGFPKTGTKFKKGKGLFKYRKIIDVTAVSGFLFAVSMEFIRRTGFRFDSRYSPAFLEEFDLAWFVRKNSYKMRIVSGLDNHYDHSFGISSGPKEIQFVGGKIWSNELSNKNIKLFCRKWERDMSKLLKP